MKSCLDPFIYSLDFIMQNEIPPHAWHQAPEKTYYVMRRLWLYILPPSDISTHFPCVGSNVIHKDTNIG